MKYDRAENVPLDRNRKKLCDALEDYITQDYIKDYITLYLIYI